MQFFSKNLSLSVCILTSILFLIVILERSNYHLISWDVFGYYLYLPQTIIHSDPGIKDFSNVQEIVDLYHPCPQFYQGGFTENGNVVIMYTMGMAIIYAPFFLIAHLWAWLGGYPMDGYSYPYEMMMLFGSVFYTLIGIFLFRKMCLRFFTDKISTLLIICLGIGTNYYFLNTQMLGMSHLYLFTYFCALIILIDSWYKQQTLLKTIAIAFIFSLLVLSRPTEFIAVLLIIFWPHEKINSFKERLRFLFVQNLKHFLVFTALFLLFIFPQLLYWKIYAGSWLYKSYTNPGEGFEFLSPYTFEFLLSFRKGWFIYTPIMFFAIIGLYFLWKENRKLFWPITLFICFNVYVLSSWSNWWYASSFGQRPVIDSYALMCIPLGFLFIWILKKGLFIQILSLGIFIFMIFLNLFQTWQINNYILSPFRMTYDYYSAIFLRTTSPPNAEELMLIDRGVIGNPPILKDSSRYIGKDIYYNSFESVTETKGGYYQDSIVYTGKRAYTISGKDEHCPGFKIPFNQISDKDHAWIRVSMKIYLTDSPEIIDPVPFATMENSNRISYNWKGISVKEEYSEAPINQWIHLEFEYITPELRTKKDNFSVSLWKAGTGLLVVDDIKIRAFIPI